MTSDSHPTGPRPSAADPVEQTPAHADVRAALDRVLNADLFATAGRHSRLLRYLVERTLAGEGDQLKEYVLGIDVFDRQDAYDPRLDSIVRVEVRRLRSRLDDYYQGPGATDPLVISIPRGSYVPVFAPRATAPAAAPAPTPTHRVRRSSPVLLIAAVLGLALAALAVNLAVNRDRAPARASDRPGIAVLPFQHFSTLAADALLVARLTDAVTSELARLGTVSVASRTSAARYGDSPYSVPEIAKALDVAFVIEASATVQPDRVDVDIRLVDGARDRKVWVGEYALARDDLTTGARKMAADASDAALRVRP